jgi:virulence-associated protein VagC
MLACHAEHADMSNQHETELVLIQVRVPKALKFEAQRALVGRGGMQRCLYPVVVRALERAVESGKSEGIDARTPNQPRRRKSA